MMEDTIENYYYEDSITFESEQQWNALIFTLANIAKEKKITHQKIADDLGMNRSNITKTFNGRHCPTLRTFLKIAKAINVNITLHKI